MSFQATLLPVFVASPGDLPEERSAVVDQINRWNRDHAVQERVAFVPVAWEWAVAAQGGGGQHQINEQQVRGADVVIALFKARLGAATAHHPSGTAEEISIGIEQGAHVGVLISRQPAPPGVYTGEEYERLQAYIRTLQQWGLTQDFTTHTELRDSVNRILWRAASTHRHAAGTSPQSASQDPSGRPDWQLSHWQGDTYAIENVGDAPAFNVILTGHPTLVGPDVVDGGPDLAPGDQMLFMAVAALQTESRAIDISWLAASDGLDSDRLHRSRHLPPRPRR